jgi:hypothetical protein
MMFVFSFFGGVTLAGNDTNHWAFSGFLLAMQNEDGRAYS